MASKDDDSVKTTTQTVSDFLKNPGQAYARVQAGERVVLTGKDGEEKVILHAKTIADYANK